MRNSNFNVDILDKYPYPLAGTYARFVDQREASAQHNVLLSLFEVLLKYTTAAALAQYLQTGGADPALAGAVASLRRPSLGHWAGLLRQVLTWRTTQRLVEDQFVFPKLAAGYARSTDALAAGVWLVRRVQGGGSAKVSLRQLFDLFVEYRNKQAHGAGQDAAFYGEMVPLLQKSLEELMLEIAGLAERELVFVESISILPRDARSILLLPLIGDRPRLRPQEYVTSAPDENPSPQQLYLLLGDTLAGAVTLHPLLVFIPTCATCRTAQVGVLNSATERTVEYLCYACGHTNTIPELVDDLSTFLTRFDVQLKPEPERPTYRDEPAVPRTSQPAGPWIVVQGAKPDATAGRVLGRDDELAELAQLASGGGTVAITGLAGVGKSTLAAAWIERLSKQAPGSAHDFAGYCWFQLRPESNVADLYALLDNQLHPATRHELPPQPDDQANQIAAWLRRTPTLLMLDDFENVMASGENRVTPGWDMLLQNAVGDIGKSVLLLTSFELPLTNRGDRPADLPLKNLETSIGVDLLKLRAGRSGTNLDTRLVELAVEVVGGHPGAIGLLGGLIADGIDLHELLHDPEFRAYRVQEVTARLLQVHESRLSREEWAVLWAVAIMEPPVSRKAITAVLPPLAAAAGTSTPGGAAALGLLTSLVRKSLLEKVDSGWTMQTILREYFSQVRVPPDDALEQAHAAAVEYYLAEPLPATMGSAADLATLIAAYRHGISAHDYSLAYDILFANPIPGVESHIVAQLEMWSNFNTLSDLAQLLLPEQRGAKPLLDNPAQQAMVLSTTGDALRVLGDVQRSISYLKQALTLFRDVGDRAGEARALARLGSAYRQTGDLRATADHGRQAVAIFNSLGDMAGEADTLNLLGFALAGLGDVPGAIASYERSLELARQTGNRRLEGMALGYMGYLSKALGEITRSVDYGEQAVAIARQIGDRRFESWFLQSLGVAYLYLGQEDRAIAQFAAALKIGAEINSQENQMWAHLSLAEAYWRKGDATPAAEHARAGLDDARKLGHRWGQAQALGELASIQSLAGDSAAALRSATEGLDVARAIDVRSSEAWCLREQARALLALGRAAEAAVPLEQALEIARTTRDQSAQVDTLHLNAQFAIAQGDKTAALNHLQSALAIQQATGTAYAQATEREILRVTSAEM